MNLGVKNCVYNEPRCLPCGDLACDIMRLMYGEFPE
jgi:hypothetical protein